MKNFSRNMLPALGVTWHYFESEREAQDFATWAENETVNDEYPCEAFVTRDDAHAPARFEVKTRNW